ncbi:putative serine/threonine-protein kinase F31E3.2 isoform X1 [Poecilia formosa]|uniref:putative serine/threonine-protein kinase F31E3.2 isoform X1 n=1 Tax=Poecilia formosa TaxID=48698 RepID=UPI000443DF59|nr:PREDICTED: putative serine/threonine-protein kinase F31E3.2 isoform X1 [Poecilia formosa]
MGCEVSKNRKIEDPPARRRFSHGFLSNVRVSIARRLGHSAVFSQPVGVNREPLPPSDGEGMLEKEKPPPALISLFLPEFPQRNIPSEDCFQVLDVIAKGSLGPVLKVRDVHQEKVWAAKVLPKSEILKQGVLEQTKDEVRIQRQLRHPFMHSVQDCWQTQHHLFIMFEYCSAGDLYTYWLLKGQFDQDQVRLLAAELGSALGFLHDLGIIHRDVKMENILLSDQGHLRLSDFGLSRQLNRSGRAFTVCGTIQYMAPEVLSGGPYSHAADWWSLGVLLFSLVTGEFPLAAESNHINMLKKVRDCSYVPPKTLSSDLILLLSELLCKSPASRLRDLQRFKTQAFFRGASFDSYILQKAPVKFLLELRSHPDWAAMSRRGSVADWFENFDFNNTLSAPLTLTELSPASPGEDVALTAEQD